MKHYSTTIRYIFVTLGVLLALAACGRGDSVAVSLQPATSPTLDAYPAPEGDLLVGPIVVPPTPTDGSFDENGNPRPTFTAAQLTQIALKEESYQAEANMRATANARPTLTPNLTPFLTYTPEPTPIPIYGIDNDCSGQQDIGITREFNVANCWFATYDGRDVVVEAGFLNVSTDRTLVKRRGGLVILTNPTNDHNDITREPVYWTPTDHGRAKVVADDGKVLTVATEDETLFTFDVATRTWGPPPTPTLEAQPEAQPTSTVEAQPEAQATPTSPVTIFVPWAQ